MAKLKIYTTPPCPYCHQAMDFLREKGVEFEEIDVTASKENAKEMIMLKGLKSVPQIVINGKVIVGFDREALEEEIEAMEK